MRYRYMLSLFIVSTLSQCATNTELEDWWSKKDRQFIISELERTSSELNEEIRTLNESQWNFKEAPERWNIGEIIEHLEIQNQLHYREISVIANSPRNLEYRTITEGQDQFFSKYATDTIKGQANWFLVPLGRFPTVESGTSAFFRARNNLIEYVKKTDVDLRKQFTFRAPMHQVNLNEVKIGQVRDLHQLLLTGIAHTDRHIAQIRNIKMNVNYPTVK